MLKGQTFSLAPQTGISRVRGRVESAAAAFAIVFLLGAVAAPQAQAQGFTVLHTFTNSPDGDGANPSAGLVRARAGNLFYGTTSQGGTSGFGTVFKVTGTTETVLYSFTGGADGGNPFAGLVMDAAGNLYGTTKRGAAGYGTVFKLSAGRRERD